MLYLLYRMGRYLALKLPLGVSYPVAVLLADIYYLFARNDKQGLASNLRIILETDDKNTINSHIKKIFRNFAKYLVDFFRFSELSKEYILSHITIEGKEKVDKALARGKGAILLSAHLGNWELGGAIVASLGYPFYAIALDHADKKINRFFIRQRSFADVKIIPIGAQLKNCFRVLRNNNLLAILGDRDFSNHGVAANFFNRPTILPKGPAFFSLRTGAPIIPTFLVRTDSDKFKLIFDDIIEGRGKSSEEKDAAEIMARYTSVIERYIKKYPGQWYAFRKMWD